MTIPAQYPNDMLTTKLLHHGAAGSVPLYWFLEQLATDSIYSFADDFDDGISEAKWINNGFLWDGDDLHGSIFGVVTPDLEEDREREGLGIRSRRYGWSPGHRCVAITRFTLGGNEGKVEFGFTDDEVTEIPAGVVTNRATPTANAFMNDFSVAVRDTDDDDVFGIVSVGQNNSAGAGTTDTSMPIPIGTDFSIMLALNEQEESRLWVNGVETTIERSGPSRASQLGLWLHSTGNASGAGAGLNVDYIQAWQERQTV